MNIPVTHRHALLAGLIGLLITLLIHDWNLYPNLRPYEVPVLSILRFFLLTLSVAFGWLLTCRPRFNGWKKLFLWIGWLFFLPYTIYSVTEIRHVAEQCRLAQGVYTGMCVDQLWTLFPTFIYALAGIHFFTFTLSQVATRLIPKSSTKRLFILGMCLYTSAASVFGLYTRLNVWDGLTKPLQTLSSIGKLLQNPNFLLNVIVYFLFTSILFFFLNRILYRAYRYIF